MSTSLEQLVHRQSLLLEAMGELLEEAGVMSLDQWMARAEAIDRRDGEADGRRGQEPISQSCRGCGRTLAVRLARCVYCGGRDLVPVC